MSQKIEIEVHQTECAIEARIGGQMLTVCTVDSDSVIAMADTQQMRNALGDLDNFSADNAEILAKCLLRAVDIARVFEKDARFKDKVFNLAQPSDR